MDHPVCFVEEGGTALTLVYIGLIIHTDSPLTHHPCLQTLQVWHKILKTHIFVNHWLAGTLLFMYLWSDYYSPLPQLLHATVVNNNQIKCIGQNFKLLNSQFQTNSEKSSGTVSDVGSGDYVVMFFCHIPMTGWHFHLLRSGLTCWNWVPVPTQPLPSLRHQQTLQYFK